MGIFGRGFMAGFADGWHKEMDRQHEERKWNATFEENRRNTLLELASKRYASDTPASRKAMLDYQRDLGFLADRMGSAEDQEAAQAYLYNLNIDPENASIVRKTITEYEEKHGMVMPPEQIMEAIPLLVLNAGDDEFQQKFADSGDYIDAILRGDLMDDELYEELYREGTLPGPGTSGLVTVKPDPAVFGGDDKANTVEMTRLWDLQNEVFKERLVEYARKKALEYQEKGNTTEAARINDSIAGVSGQAGDYHRDVLRKEFGQQLYDELIKIDSPAFEFMETNPHFLPFRPAEEAVEPTVVDATGTAPDVEPPPVEPPPLEEDKTPTQLAEERNKMRSYSSRIDGKSKAKLRQLVADGAISRQDAIRAFEEAAAKKLGLDPSQIAGLGQYVLEVEGI